MGDASQSAPLADLLLDSALTVGGAAEPKAEPVPEQAHQVFGDNLPGAVAYAGLLAGRGRLVGVIGPREAERIWSRHLMNCAVVESLIPMGSRVADVGSGAGLPGIPLALARPDISVRLIESLSRRVRFLTEAVAALGLQNRVSVVHARAEDCARGEVDVVTARAVAELPVLARWCLPLTVPRTGIVLAMRGEKAVTEMQGLRPSLRVLHAAATLHELESLPGHPPTRVVRLART